MTKSELGEWADQLTKKLDEAEAYFRDTRTLMAVAFVDLDYEKRKASLGYMRINDQGRNTWRLVVRYEDDGTLCLLRRAPLAERVAAAERLDDLHLAICRSDALTTENIRDAIERVGGFLRRVPT